MKWITLGTLLALLLAGCAIRDPSRPQMILTGPDARSADYTPDALLCEQLQAMQKILDGQARSLQERLAVDNERHAVLTELRHRHPDWDFVGIGEREIRVGMTEDQARCSWGHPSKINRASYGDQWVYSDAIGSARYLYFKGGLLESFN